MSEYVEVTEVTEQDFAPAISQASTYPVFSHQIGGIILETGLLIVPSVGESDEGYVMDTDEAIALTDHLPDGPFLGIWYTKDVDGIDQDDKEKAAHTCGTEENSLHAAALVVITPSRVYFLDENGEPFFDCPHKGE